MVLSDENLALGFDVITDKVTRITKYKLLRKWSVYFKCHIERQFLNVSIQKLKKDVMAYLNIH